ncbi:hypothetical protein ACFT0G_26800 [Streptomyces sp. NPDC057020]|uniref:hypothetical protein n=1 Tax=unclassified Streptomyces TaxID=2593676 RepID=UPI00093A21C4|nr:hypothetical protein [Streptomyces sp. CB02009]OKJ60883.1 hypothetical protein AMK27_16865 [Streptomyces sp. CB02009]
MAATARSQTLLRSGVGVAAVGVAALLVVAFVDLGTADQIASVTGVVLAVAGLGLSLWAQFGQGGRAAPVEASGTRSVAAGGSIGTVVTGDGVRTPPTSSTPQTPPASQTLPAQPAPTAPPTGGGPGPASGPVTASGERSVAAGGDIGSASTGDA